MTRGTAFLHARAQMLGARPSFDDRGRRARVIGNALRELDRFLNTLARAVLDGHSPDNRRDRERRLPRLGFLSLPETAYARLHALNRSSACLFHCEGVVRRPDARGGAWMTAGWSSDDVTLDRLPLGATLSPSPANLTDTCRFYQSIADDLLSYRTADVHDGDMRRADSLPFFPAASEQRTVEYVVLR